MESQSISKLAEALSKAQGMMESAKKDSVNPHFKSKYADLASVIEAIREPLSKNGLSYVQYLEKTDVGLALVTKLMHSTGEWISGSLPLMIGKNDMQGLGSSLTYARRYSLSAMTGIAQDDDDGNTATAKPDTSKWVLGQKELADLKKICEAVKYSGTQMRDECKRLFGGRVETQITETEFGILCQTIGAKGLQAMTNEIDKKVAGMSPEFQQALDEMPPMGASQ